MSLSQTVDFENAVRMEHLRKASDQEQARCDAVISDRKREKEEYSALKKKLGELPLKMTHNIMIPFGGVGFVPGKIIHSNEVMVLLGNNYFAERTCHQACQIIDRRIEVLDEVIRDHQSDKKLIEDRFDFATRLFQKNVQNPDEVEIREDYDEEKERIAREKRRSRVAHAKKDTPAATTRVSKKEHEDIIKHLEKLELIEKTSGMRAHSSKGENNDEEHTSEEDDDNSDEEIEEIDVKPPPGVDPKQYISLLNRVNQLMESSEDGESSDDEEKNSDPDSASDEDSDGLDSDDIPEEEQEEGEKKPIKNVGKTTEKPLTILQNTGPAKQSKRRNSRVRFPDELESGPTGSFFNHNVEEVAEVKPILRNKNPTPVDEKAVEKMNAPERTILPQSETAFPGQIVERDCQLGPSTSTAHEEAPKKVSKFKQMRMNR